MEQELAGDIEAKGDGPEDDSLVEEDGDGGGAKVASPLRGDSAEGLEAAPEEPDAASGAVLVAGSGIVLQSFTLTFVAEWGDRSQIATIAMGADQDLIGVTLGGAPTPRATTAPPPTAR